MLSDKLRKAVLQYAMQGKLTQQLESDSSVDELLNRIKTERELGIKNKTIRKGKGVTPIKDDDILYEIPGNWRWERFGNLVSNFDGDRRPIAKEDRKKTHASYDYYGATGAIDKVDDYIFDGEYLMIGEDGGNFYTNRDNSFIANGKFWANNHVHVVQPIIINIKFLKYLLDSCNLPLMGLVTGIAVPKLNQEHLNSILVPVPPIEEQQRIVDRVESIMKEIDKLEKIEREREKL